MGDMEEIKGILAQQLELIEKLTKAFQEATDRQININNRLLDRIQKLEIWAKQHSK